MSKLLIAMLVSIAAGYTLFIGWMVWFAIAFGGTDLTGAPVGGLVGLGMVALSPIPVCTYCTRRVQALRQAGINSV